MEPTINREMITADISTVKGLKIPVGSRGRHTHVKGERGGWKEESALHHTAGGGRGEAGRAGRGGEGHLIPPTCMVIQIF
jgi:hypothetical protein